VPYSILLVLILFFVALLLLLILLVVPVGFFLDLDLLFVVDVTFDGGPRVFRTRSL
jgi:hypothetical protein